MLKVGLTGGIGAGKSEVSKRLAAQGAVVIDADIIAREVVAPGTPGLEEVVQAFGPGVLAADGSLNRPALGEIVFGDADKLATLNAIVHPRVYARQDEVEEEAGPGAIVVHDVPLIFENGLAPNYEVIVVVDIPPRMQLDRLMRMRGMSKEQAQSRIAAQATREQRLSIADIVVDNSASLAELDRQVGELWSELRRRNQAKAGGAG